LFDSDIQRCPSKSTADKLATARGYKRLDDPVESFFAPGEKSSTSLQLVAGRCYLFSAIGSNGIDSISLRLKKGRDILTSDTTRKSNAWTSYCAESDGPVRLLVSVISGSGTIKTDFFGALRSEIIELVGPPIKSSHETEALVTRIEAHQKDATSRGYFEHKTIFKGQVAAGERHNVNLSQLSGGACYMITSIAGGSSSDHSMRILASKRGNDQDFFVNADDVKNGEAAFFCADDKTIFKSLELIMLSGQGQIAVILSSLKTQNLPGRLFGYSRELLETAARAYSQGFVVKDKVNMKWDKAQKRWSAELKTDVDSCYMIVAVVQGSYYDSFEIIYGESERKLEKNGETGVIGICTKEKKENMTALVRSQKYNDSQSCCDSCEPCKVLEEKEVDNPPKIFVFKSDTRSYAGDTY